MIQLDFFKTKEEFEFFELSRELKEVLLSTEKVRKSLFAKHCLLKRENDELKARLEILERNICRGENV